jgi:phosphoglucosamine mutase
MERRLFGTDGIRGRSNVAPITPEMVLRIGQAAGAYCMNLNPRQKLHRVVIGKDTRLSGYMMENALTAGFTSVGMQVVLVGPMPTPAIALLTRSMRADLGVMISASHNKYMDNGIKLFSQMGKKLSDSEELEIEQLVEQPPQLARSSKIGRAKRVDDAAGRYIHFVKSSFPEDLDLYGLKIVIDSANGAAHSMAQTALWELGADTVAEGVSPDGTNINKNRGSTHPEFLQKRVRQTKADIGIALDGDGDRVILVDEKGAVVDGDQVMALIASSWKRRGTLKGGGIAATVMSNLGLERFLNGQGLNLVRAKVGDRYVLEAMQKNHYNVGGEQSGHIILTDFGATGDGLLVALQVLTELVHSGRPASELLNVFEPVPQKLKSVRFRGVSPLENTEVKKLVADGRARLNGNLVVRPSGTEPVIRVMAQGDDDVLISRIVDGICAAVQAA